MSLLDYLLPRRSNEADLNPANIFQNYTTAVGAMGATAPSTDDEKLLAQSWKIFDNEAARRTSIDTRAAALMPAVTIAATLVTGVITLLKDATLPIYALAVILATLVLALAYLVRTMYLLFKVHGLVFRYTPDPSDLPTPASVPAGQTSPYDRLLACRVMQYTVGNYRIDNVQLDSLVVAQRSFFSALCAIAIGGAAAGMMIVVPPFSTKDDNSQPQVQNQQLRTENQQLQAQTQEQQAKGEQLQATNRRLQAQTQELQAKGEQLQATNRQLQAQNQELYGEVERLQHEAKFVEAGDLLFLSGGYQLSSAGKTELNNNIVPMLKGLQNAKVVVYGYTDNTPVSRQLEQAGIPDNLTLSLRRAGSVVAYLISQGVNQNIISAKGLGETHPVAPNDTPADQKKNRRIIITVQGPGAPG